MTYNPNKIVLARSFCTSTRGKSFKLAEFSVVSEWDKNYSTNCIFNNWHALHHSIITCRSDSSCRRSPSRFDFSHFLLLWLFIWEAFSAEICRPWLSVSINFANFLLYCSSIRVLIFCSVLEKSNKQTKPSTKYAHRCCNRRKAVYNRHREWYCKGWN